MSFKKYGVYNYNPFKSYIGKILPNTAVPIPPSIISFDKIVPNVIGLSYNSAIIALNNANIPYNIFNISSSKDILYQPYASQGGYVSFQSPPAGQYYSTSTVNLQVILYSQSTVVVPNILGLSVSAAQTALSSAGLNYSSGGSVSTSNSSLSQTIATQNYSSGTSVAPGTSITYTYYYYNVI
jgi:beta-lactam-binding protein with PASTA domain